MISLMRSHILLVVFLISLQASLSPETESRSPPDTKKQAKKQEPSPISSPEQIPRQPTSPSLGKKRLGKITEEKGVRADSEKKPLEKSGAKSKAKQSSVNSELTGLSLTLNFKEEDKDEEEDDGRHGRNKSRTEVKYSDAHEGPETKKTITITGLKQKVPGRIADFPGNNAEDYDDDEEEDVNPLRRRFGDGEGLFGMPPPVIMTTPMWTPPPNRRKVTSKKYEPGVLEALTANLMTTDHQNNKNLATDVTNVALELLDGMMGHDGDDDQAEVVAGAGQEGRRRRNRRKRGNRRQEEDSNHTQQALAGYQQAAMYSYDPISGQNFLVPVFNPYLMQLHATSTAAATKTIPSPRRRGAQGQG